MKVGFTILFVVISLISFSQADTTFISYDRNIHDDSLYYETDTIISNNISGKVILHGTTILPMTYNMIGAIGYGFTLKKVTGTTCKNRGRERVYKKDTRVVDIAKTDSSWICELSIVTNCCHDFLCEISIKQDSILNFIYTGYGDHCSCNCCFGLMYEIDIKDYGDVAKITHCMINGRETTLKKID